MIRCPSPDEIERAKTPAGGWTKEQLAAWGVAWPPPSGWKADLKRKWKAQCEDDEAIARDWQAIGGDFRTVISW